MDLRRTISPVLVLGLFFQFSNLWGQKVEKKIELNSPQEKITEWIKTNAIPIETLDPNEDDSDLLPLIDMIGSRRIVSLGESTHGTSEMFKIKHRITKFLAKKMGFTIFALEANMPEARAVNHYILTGEGNARKVLDGLYFWTWNTNEVLDMIKWMREYNQIHKRKIEFYGFDLQTPTVAITNVTQFIKKADRTFLKTTIENYEIVSKVHQTSVECKGKEYLKIDFNVWYEPAKKVYDHLMANRNRYLKSFPKKEVDRVLQDAQIILQGAETYIKGKRSRDKSMADNLKWILNQNPEAKIIIWAHNDHISRYIPTFQTMGYYLNRTFTEDMFVFGFAFHKGYYTAIGKNGIDIYTTSPSKPGSVEWYFKSAGIPKFIIDIRSALEGAPGAQWLNQKLLFRSIGAYSSPHAFNPRNISKEFDAIIFFEKTTPTHCFRSNAYLRKSN